MGPYFLAVSLSAEPNVPRSQLRYRMFCAATSLARCAGVRWSLHCDCRASGSLAQESGAISLAGGPTALWTALRPPMRLLSASPAERTGYAAIAVTATMTRIAQPAVVIVLFISD